MNIYRVSIYILYSGPLLIHNSLDQHYKVLESKLLLVLYTIHASSDHTNVSMDSYFDPQTVRNRQELYTWRQFSLSYFRSSLIIVQVQYLEHNIINTNQSRLFFQFQQSLPVHL